MKHTDRIQQLLNLLTCILLLASLAVIKQGKLMGHDFAVAAATTTSAGDTAAAEVPGALRTLADGSVVVNTTDIAADVSGYAGRVPLEITLKDNVVTGIKALGNAESKPFFDKASALFAQWTGKNVAEAERMKVDAVSGATFSSKAIIGNVQRGLQYVQHMEHGATAASGLAGSNAVPSAKDIVGLAVVLLAAVAPLFVKNRRYRVAQTVLNVVVLGFWCGAFLSYTSIISFFANGWHGWAFAAVAVMLVTAFVYPLFGKPSYYCANVCPFGGMQQLAGSLLRFKLKLSPAALRRLDIMRQVLWALLMLFVWSGVWSAWIDYEPFTAFLFGSASWVAIAVAAITVAVSFVIVRPYCRFVCPMGTLFRYSQRNK